MLWIDSAHHSNIFVGGLAFPIYIWSYASSANRPVRKISSCVCVCVGGRMVGIEIKQIIYTIITSIIIFMLNFLTQIIIFRPYFTSNSNAKPTTVDYLDARKLEMLNTPASVFTDPSSARTVTQHWKSHSETGFLFVALLEITHRELCFI